MPEQANVSLLWKLTLGAAVLLAIWWLAVSSPTPPSEVPESAAAAADVPVAPAARAEAAAQTTPAPPAVDPAREPTQPPSAAPAAAPAQPSAAPSAPVPQKQGPVEELSRRFAGESRGSSSEQDEGRVRAAFTHPEIPASVLRRVECRRSVCRADLRWSADHDAAYVLGLTHAVGTFSAPVGFEAAGDADADGHRPLVVYFGLAR
jgi:hypothetical protein